MVFEFEKIIREQTTTECESWMMNNSIDNVFQKEGIAIYQFNMFDEVNPIDPTEAATEGVFKATLRNNRKAVILKRIHLSEEFNLNDLINETSENLFVHNESIKLCSFKVSTRMSASRKLTEKFRDSVQYLDSQYLRLCDSTECRRSSDIYSLGVLMREIACGDTQFESIPDSGHLSKNELLNHIKKCNVNKPIAGIPRGYFKIYTDCMQHEERLRPDISQVFRDLKKINVSDKISELEILIPLFNDNQNKSLIKADILNAEDVIPESQSKSLKKSDESTVRSSTETDMFIKSLFHFFTNLFFKQHLVMAPVLIKKYIKDHKKNPVRVFHQLLQNRNRSYFTSMIGCFYQYGIGVVVDYKMAFEYYSLAANDTFDFENETPNEMPNSETWSKSFKSQRMTGIRYMNGTGITKDIIKAIFWLQKAADNGDTDAIDELEDIIGFMFLLL
ncbi:18396_t:CDS:2 [Acaulospora morrowiae]|uniref:18396_t:CDS:1 n=1 Tax=Acaulospora morrowiae TaxID=94023 RepID=A0A9N9GK84_9GLOM|nr:18396_t:CDS:2 [Acaulospora morrowiae]